VRRLLNLIGKKLSLGKGETLLASASLLVHLSRYNEVVGMYNIDPQPAAYVRVLHI
jgi:hypothetical protein